MPRVLLIDDEEPLRASLAYALTREGYSVTTAADGPSALERARERDPDVVVLDLMLPGISGLEICRQLRATSDVPVIMLTARDRCQDKLDGLAVGADDYVTKPFETPELIARLGAVLRRRTSAQRLLEEDRLLVQRMEELLRIAPIHRLGPLDGPSDPPEQQQLGGGRVVVDLATATVLVAGQPITTSAAEYALLRILLSYPGRVVTRTELIEPTWGSGAADGHTLLAVHIRCLREKIEEDPADPRVIVSIPGIGFRYDGTM